MGCHKDLYYDLFYFLVYINDLEEGVTGKLLKFADDTKLFRKAKNIVDKQKLQYDIDKLFKWSEKLQMLLNSILGNVNIQSCIQEETITPEE